MIPNIKTICALGTGTMGAGTALSFAVAGYDVYLHGRSRESLARGMKSAAQSLASLVKYDFVPDSDVPPIMGRIRTTTVLEDAARDADLVIESVAEEIELKKGIFQALNAICPPHAIFATNTSALSPTKLASVLDDRRQDKFVCMHFFNPPHLMPTVEAVPGERTSSLTMDTACAILTGLGKEPARLAREAPGFVVNQIQATMLGKAFAIAAANGNANLAMIDSAVQTILGAYMPTHGIFMSKALIEGAKSTSDAALYAIAIQIYKAMLDKAREIVTSGIATPGAIDTAFKGTLGLRMPVTGPIISADMGGLHVFKSIFETLGIPVPALIESAVQAGHLGSKTGRGIFEWPPERLRAMSAAREERIVAYLKGPR